MVYYNYEMRDNVPVAIDALLHKYFPEKTWGVCASVDMKHGYQNYEINKVRYTGGGRHGDETEWTHYANILLDETGKWEVNTQFNGEKEDEMWIYGYYRNFANACKRVLAGMEEIKPFKII